MEDQREKIVCNLMEFVNNVIEIKEHSKDNERKKLLNVLKALRTRARQSPTLYNIYGYYGFFSFLFYKSDSIKNLYDSYDAVKRIMSGEKNVELVGICDNESYSLYTALLIYMLFLMKNIENELDEIFISRTSVKLSKLLEILKREKRYFEKIMKEYNLLIYIKQLLTLTVDKNDDKK